MESTPEPVASATWDQPVPGDPSPYVVHQEELMRMRKKQGLEGTRDASWRINAWHALTLNERKAYERGTPHDCYQAAMANFNASIPLSPSVSGASSSDSEVDDERDRRAIQRWNRYRRDYPSKTSQAAGPGSTVSFPFLRLPFDIRRMVYVLIVKRPQPIVQMDADGSAKHPNGPIDLRIALTSKPLFTEVMTTFFEDNVIELEILPFHTIGLPGLCNPHAASAAHWPLQSIKRVQLFISYDRKEEINFVIAELQKLCKAVGKCAMAELRIIPYCRRFSYAGLDQSFDRTLDASFDQALAHLEPLRGLQDLVFADDIDEYNSRDLRSIEFRVAGTKAYQERLRSIVTKPTDSSPKEVDE